VETNRYYSQFLDNSDDGPSPQREVTEAEMFAFLALTVQMGHAGQGGLKDYWTKMERLSCKVLSHTKFSTFHGQWREWSWQDEWQTMDNVRIIWNSKDELFKILQPFRTFGSIRSHCEIQRKGSFQIVHPEKK